VGDGDTSAEYQARRTAIELCKPQTCSRWSR
jgi:hypothetical protein